MTTFIYSNTREGQANNVFGVSLSDTYAWDNIDLTRSVPCKIEGHKDFGVNIPGVDNELGDKLVFFKTFQDGLNAGFWLLWTYFTGKPPVDTPEGIGDRWSGDTEAKAAAQYRKSYGEDIGSIMRVPPLLALKYVPDSPAVAKALMRMENGAPVFLTQLVNVPPEMYETALEYGQSS